MIVYRDRYSDLRGKGFVAVLPRLIDDQWEVVAKPFAYEPIIRSVLSDDGALSELRTTLEAGSALRARLLSRLLAESPVHLIGASRQLSRLCPDFEADLVDRVADPFVQGMVAGHAPRLMVHQLVGLLRWSYSLEPELAYRVEREVVGRVRPRMASELISNPPWMRGAMRMGRVSPIMDDLIREAMKLAPEGVVTLPCNRPLGLNFERTWAFERDPREALVDPMNALRFLEVPHLSRRRRIATESVARTLREVANLDDIVEAAMDLRLTEMVGVLRRSGRHSPGLSGALRMRLSRGTVLEDLVDRNLETSRTSDFAGLLAALQAIDPRVHATATDILSQPRRASRLAERMLKGDPGEWIGLLRTPHIARPMLGSIELRDWSSFWAYLAPDLPQWSRAVQHLLLNYGYASLRQAPAEYILLGTGPAEWSLDAISLRDLSNAIYGGGVLGDGMVVCFLDHISHDSLIASNYRDESLWALASFIFAIHNEHSPRVLKMMTTESLTERLMLEADRGWRTSGTADQVGFVALVGALALAGADPGLGSLSMETSDSLRLIDASQAFPNGPHLVEAGLRRLALP